MTELLLDARDLRKRYDHVQAVDGVSLTVAPGEAYGLVGPDGAGKTTTLRLLVGALHGQGGSVRILGTDVRAHPSQALSHVGYLAQRFALYGELTVLENLSFFATVRGVPQAEIAARTAELLGFVGLAGFEARRAAQLSGGMKQKLGLACALIHRPQLLLLDEPTAGVDPATRQDFWQLLIRLLSQGVGLVVSTPYMDEAARCHRLGFMSRGRVLTSGSPRQLTARLAGRVIEVVAGPRGPAERVCRADPAVADVVAFGDRLHLRLARAEQAGTAMDPRNGHHPPTAGAASNGGDHDDPVVARLQAALAAAGIAGAEVRHIPAGLEDVFIALLAGEALEAERE